MTDLAALAPCSAGKRGAHALSYIIPEDSGGWLTAVCDHCGTVRRIPAAGALMDSLDDLSADDIVARIGWTVDEVRE